MIGRVTITAKNPRLSQRSFKGLLSKGLLKANFWSDSHWKQMLNCHRMFQEGHLAGALEQWASRSRP